jgi:hypothetical protein
MMTRWQLWRSICWKCKGIVGIKWKLVNGFWANLISVTADGNVAKLQVWSTKWRLVGIVSEQPRRGADVAANVHDKTGLLTKKMSNVMQEILNENLCDAKKS